MALRGIQPEMVKKRLKTLMYGVSGAGKTMAAISFPKPYLIDTEKGYEHQHYLDKIEQNGGRVFHTTDFDELLEEVSSLISDDHPYKTLIIDPLTVIYNNLVEKCAADRVSPSNPDGMAHGGHYIASNRKMKKLINLLLKVDMNVIITSHSKNEYGHNMAVLGQTFDCYKKLDYLFDLVFEIHKKGQIREAIVRKSRIVSFPEADRFMFSYDEIADRYGRDILEKDSIATPIATQEQIIEVQKICEEFLITEESMSKWFKKAGATFFDDMPASAMDSIITFYNTKRETKHETL